MKWRREIDYHGSRAYSAERPAEGLGIFAWLKCHVEDWLRFGARPSTSTVLRLEGGESRFSLLGANNDRGAPPADCAFPTPENCSQGKSAR